MAKIYNTILGSFMLGANITAKEVAKKCNVGLKTVYNWANLVNKPQDIITINKLATILNVDVDVLVELFKD